MMFVLVVQSRMRRLVLLLLMPAYIFYDHTTILANPGT
jgi:hypothetical protein